MATVLTVRAGLDGTWSLRTLPLPLGASLVQARVLQRDGTVASLPSAAITAVAVATPAELLEIIG
jgi:hypothetical protein